jgi:dethiobiotin synthetase
MNLFVTAIGTDSGKTLVSAVLTEALQCPYWKPIQCGNPMDAETVAALVSIKLVLPYKSTYLKSPISPHAAAEIEGVRLHVCDFKKPDTTNALVIEGAGGILVPLNDQETMSDLAIHISDKVILVVNHYLGSINHTLLTLEVLQARGLNLVGIVFNGEPNEASERAILLRTSAPVLFRIEQQTEVSPLVVRSLAKRVPVELLLS